MWENRNYRRAIKTPKGIVPDAIENLNKTLKQKCDQIVADKRGEIEKELEDFVGFIDDVDAKDEEIEQQIKDVLSEDSEIKSLLADIEDLKKKYPFLAAMITEEDEESE